MQLNDLLAKIYRYIVIGVIALVLILSGGIYIGIQVQITRHIEQDLNMYAETSKRIILEKNEVCYTYLEGISSKITDLVDHKENILKALKRIPNSNKFELIGIANKTGILYISKKNSTGYSEVDISKRNYFKNSIKGNRSVEGPMETINPDLKGQNVVAYSVPIYINKEVVGLIVATVDEEFLYGHIEDIHSENNRNTYIIMNNKIIASTDSRLEDMSKNDFLKSKPLKIEKTQWEVLETVNKKEIKAILSPIILMLVFLDSIIVFWGSHIYSLICKEIHTKTEEIKEHRKVLSYEAFFDELTCVNNRRGGLQKLRENLELAEKNKVEFTIVYIDIDNLKKTNDNKGHSEGDRMIKTISDFLTENMRESDFVARIGGDEFIVGLYDCDLKIAKKRFDKIQEKLKMNSASLGFEFPLLFSYGLAQYNKKEHIGIDCFITEADVNMYKEKQKHRQKNL